MNINDQVFIVEESTLYNNEIPDSVSIMPAKIVSLGKFIVVEIPSFQDKVIVLSVNENSIYPTIAKALEETQKRLSGNIKVTKLDVLDNFKEIKNES